MIEIDPTLIWTMIEKGKRLDNRAFDEFRSIVIEPNIVTSAEGSARAKIGDTEVIAGVKMDISKPFPDTPADGALSVNAELLPLASVEFESGPPNEQSIELARVVDRAIRESKVIQLDKLCLEPGKSVWTVFVDIDVINDNGNLIDTACLAAVAALLNTRMPLLEKKDEDYKVNYDVKTEEKLPMMGIPVETTFAKIGSSIIADPKIEEIKSMDARLTVGTIDGKICSLQKGESGGFTVEEINQILELAEKKGSEIREKLKSSILR